MKYVIVLGILICLAGVLFHILVFDKLVEVYHRPGGSEDQRDIEDHGEIIDDKLTMMKSMENTLVGRRIQTLPIDVTAQKRLLVIGDVHGCLTELKQLLQQAQVLKTDDINDGIRDDCLVIFCGDLVNKGPNQIEVLDFAMKTERVYSVAGNHEYYWASRNKSPRHQDYLIGLPYIISIPEHNALVVHAGLYADVPLPNQIAYDVIHMRNMVPQADGSYKAYTEDTTGVHWATLWPGPEHVYFGHDARRGKDDEGHPRVQRFPLVTGLDTRCVKGGALTGVILPLENEEFYSVNCPIVYDRS